MRVTSIQKAVTEAITDVVQKSAAVEDSLSLNLLMPIYTEVLDLINRYSSDPEIDAVTDRVRNLLGIPLPKRYTSTDDEQSDEPTPPSMDQPA